MHYEHKPLISDLNADHEKYELTAVKSTPNNLWMFHDFNLNDAHILKPKC